MLHHTTLLSKYVKYFCLYCYTAGSEITVILIVSYQKKNNNNELPKISFSKDIFDFSVFSPNAGECGKKYRPE